MNKPSEISLFSTNWEAERAHAELELREIERERTISDVVRLIKRFELSANEIAQCMETQWLQPKGKNFMLFEPYFGRR